MKLKPYNPTSYFAYINSLTWKLRSAYEKFIHPFCSLCSSTYRLQVHHNTYKRLGREKPGDLTVLCSDCHRIFHENYEYDGKLGHFVLKNKKKTTIGRKK